MIHFSLADAQKLLSITEPCSHSQLAFTGMSIDSRTLKTGNLFVAIRGERVDGHDFVMAAHTAGASCALVEKPIALPIAQLVVSDVTEAMGILSKAWREQFSIPFVAVTGSNGKTTTKNMIAAIMSAAAKPHEVLATLGTLNNHWGLPLTLSRLSTEHHYAVLELGMNHFGEIDYLSKLAQPNVAVITNAAHSHLEGVGSVAGVAQAKAEIFHGLKKGGTAILNRDDAFYDFWRTQINPAVQVLSFGFHKNADIFVEMKEATTVIVHTPKGHIEIELALLGKHNIANLLAATAATLAINIDLAVIKKGLETIKPAPGRLEVHTLGNGVKIIDDTYNANPFSLEAAVATLAAFMGKKILVLGDMKELGTDAKILHHDAGEKIRQAGIDYLFTYGDLSANTAQSFGEGAYHFNEQEKLVTALKPLLYNQTTILIKGSRSMRMEQVLKGLVS